MRKRVFIAGLTLLALLSLALPVSAAKPTQQSTVDDGTCLASIRSLPSGAHQVWIYCYAEGGYYPAGTAMHLVAAPLDHPSADTWGDAVDLSGLPGETLDGTYYVKENTISPVAVAAKTGRWEILPDWLLRNPSRLRDRLQSAAQEAMQMRTRLQSEERLQQEAGSGVGQTEQNRARIETRERANVAANAGSPANTPGNGPGPSGEPQGNASNGNGRGRR